MSAPDGLKEKVALSGAGAAVVSAMHAFLDSARMQEQGCWALKNLAMHDTNRAGLDAAGARSAAEAAMVRHTQIPHDLPSNVT